MNYRAEVLEIRKQRKVSVTKLSKLTGIPADRIYKWESGVGNPKAEDSEKLQEWIAGSSSEKATTRPQEAQQGEIASNVVKHDYLSGKNLENFSEAQRLLASIVHAQSGNLLDRVLAPKVVEEFLREMFSGKKQMTYDELAKEVRKTLKQDNGYRR